MARILKLALLSLIFNTAFAIYYLVFGISSGSWWLLTLGSYYLILSAVRFFVIRTKKAAFAARLTGIMLILLSVPLASTVILAVIGDRGTKFHMIVMIAIATYAFTKITIASINLVRSRRSNSGTVITLRNIAFADALVSIFALQRSMLVSFEGMSASEIRIMNAALGSAVCILVFLLGVNLLRRKKFFDSLQK